MADDLTPIDLNEADEVTQYGRVGEEEPDFHRLPKKGQKGLSLIHGRVDIAKALSLVVPFRKYLRAEDAVRYSTVGILRKAGFTVLSTPLPQNPDHLDVEFDGSWDDDVCERFDECFGEPMTGVATNG